MSDNEITILAGGWSAAFLDLTALRGLVIGVNDAAVRARCDCAVSMDRLWTEHRWHFLMALSRPAYIRTAALKNIRERPTWLTPFECNYKDNTFSTEPTILNGTNSGACAINLAFQMQPKRLFLVGFDMNRSPNIENRPYWYPDMPWTKSGGATTNGKYAEWAGQFDDAARAFGAAGVEVFNVSMTSAIRSFPKISPEEYARFK